MRRGPAKAFRLTSPVRVGGPIIIESSLRISCAIGDINKITINCMCKTSCMKSSRNICLRLRRKRRHHLDRIVGFSGSALCAESAF